MHEQQPMRRTQINLTPKQHEKLTNDARKTGISLSELIRRILDEYLKRR